MYARLSDKIMASTDEGEKNKNELGKSNLFEAPSNHLTITEVQKDTIKSKSPAR